MAPAVHLHSVAVRHHHLCKPVSPAIDAPASFTTARAPLLNRTRIHTFVHGCCSPQPSLRRKLRPKASQLHCGRPSDHRRRSRTAAKWWQQPRLRASVSSGDQNPLGEESYWEQAEGKKKLREIEDLKELVSEARKLQNTESETNQQAYASNESSIEAETERERSLREELARRAKEQAERRRQAEQMFQLGQRAYGRGMYDKAVEFLEAALTNIQGASSLGGEVQLWLAMGYEAINKHKECIALYKKLEATHPSKAIRRQAKDLRYILEAPKLKISKEEMVTIPLLGENESSETRTWSKMYKERKKKMLKKVPPMRDYMEDWLVWKPPRWERSPYFWVAVAIWLTLVGVSLMFQD